jgi:diguanylate cyclase (GGDEF)-like protein
MGLQQAFLDATIYVTDSSGNAPDWVSEQLRGNGARTVIDLETIKELAPRLRALQYEASVQPALAIITTREIDEEFLCQCRPLAGLVDEGWLALVALVHGPAPAVSTIHTALTSGCVDVLHAADGSLSGDALIRLQLAQKLLSERRLRIEREQIYRMQLADRRIMEARSHYAAHHDPVTELANRSAFEKALEASIELGNRRNIPNALLHLDLDRFKLHNEAVGHGTGDHLLLEVANLLRAALPREYLLARLGSDEFAVLLQGADEAEAMRLAEDLRASVSGIEPDGVHIVYHVAASIGVAVFLPGSVANASQVLAQAEQACYVAKTRGGNAVHLFSRDDHALEHLREDMHWARPIRQALAENRFFLAFQPILAVAEGRISHYEALLRIPSSCGGDGESARFMLAAERLGLAKQIDLWVVNKALDYLVEHPDLHLAVNLSSHAFQEAGLLPLLKEKLTMTGLAPERLTFEITETAAIMNLAHTRRMISEISELGCRFALDDFGSGFSSYSYIKQFPIDMLKIDGSFIVGIREDRRDQAIVQSMVDIGHSLDKGVVVEFIEDGETFRLLVEMGIDYAQGYYIGRPTTDLKAARDQKKQ